MDPKERDREKELKRLLYIKGALIRELKKEMKAYRAELISLGNNKGRELKKK